MRPSIIFFDEIDGLAPVRSSRQDQIHSSIVSTLLALMDGLDSRGEIVVIGATNRIDVIDPALRRPGRFDREFLFPLPSRQVCVRVCERERDRSQTVEPCPSLPSKALEPLKPTLILTQLPCPNSPNHTLPLPLKQTLMANLDMRYCLSKVDSHILYVVLSLFLRTE